LSSIHDILKQYWGYNEFRPLQEDIITSVLNGNDTLALLPTGGGKSICFQVPALVMDGLCLVVSPLIALMKDQVEQLHKRGITAAALYSGMSRREQLLIIENAQNGAYKFLYLSPERLKTQAFRERIPYLNISLLAVDEAHCISQWGYDFRPEYLMIAEVREQIKNVPVLALTASATADVVHDMQEKLLFKKKLVFRKSFTRSNLAYVVNRIENKNERMLHILNRVKGTGLVYVRNRRQTQEIAALLRQNKISADYYHAGLPNHVRIKKQEDWINDRTRVVVCTNAFGMGIDKPGVRIVIHYEMPESPESYYQEAGRAGRDGNKAYCVLLHHDGDTANAQHKLKQAFPPAEEIKRVYQALCNYYNLPVGAIPDRSFDFDLAEFTQRFKLDTHLVYPALKILVQCDLVELAESFFEPSKLRFVVSHATLYKFQVENEKYDDLIKMVLRSYGGLFDNYMNINEQQMAQRIGKDAAFIVQFLQQLTKLGLADYQPRKEKPQITFTTQRIAAEQISLQQGLIGQRKQVATDKLNAMIAYAENEVRCRSRVLVEYFNETGAEDCGVCDVCLAKNKGDVDGTEAVKIEQTLKQVLLQTPLHVNEAVNAVSVMQKDKVTAVIRHLLDTGKLNYDNEHRLTWNKKQ
jgi:ATP-dependent DNA helicase RecQ